MGTCVECLQDTVCATLNKHSFEVEHKQKIKQIIEHRFITLSTRSPSTPTRHSSRHTQSSSAPTTPSPASPPWSWTSLMPMAQHSRSSTSIMLCLTRGTASNTYY